MFGRILYVERGNECILMQLFPLTDNTGGAAVDQVQQQHLFISKLHRLTWLG